MFGKGNLIELLIRLFLAIIFIIVGGGAAWLLPRFIYRQANRVPGPFGRLLARQTGAVRTKASDVMAAAE